MCCQKSFPWLLAYERLKKDSFILIAMHFSGTLQLVEIVVHSNNNYDKFKIFRAFKQNMPGPVIF